MLGFSPLASRPLAGDFAVTSGITVAFDAGYYNITGKDAAGAVGLAIQIGDVARLSGVLATVELKGLVS